MFNINNNDGLYSYLLKLLNYWDDKICDLMDVWYKRLLWDVEEDLTSYLNSSSFSFTVVLFMLIPVSELYYSGTVYYFYIAIMALMLDVIIYYILVYLTDLHEIPGFVALALKIWGTWFYILALFNPEIYNFVVSVVFPGSGDFVLSEELFSGELDEDCGLMEDKKEIMFRIFWGLGHLAIFYIFLEGFKSYWRRGSALRTTAEPTLPSDLSYSHIYKKSLTAGLLNIFSSIERFPVFWALPLFLFFTMADFSSFSKSPLLLYNTLAIADTFRFLSYDFALFETVAWWWFFCGLLVYFGDFGSFSNFFGRIKAWFTRPFFDSNIYKILFVSIFLLASPVFWFITDNESFNDYLAVFLLENYVAVHEFGKIAAINYLSIAIYYFLKKDSEEGFVLSVFFMTCSIAIFFLGLCLNFHNDALEGADHNLFSHFNALEFLGLGSHELFVFGYDYISLLLCFMTCCVFSIVMYFSVFAEIRYKIYYFSCLFYLLIFILLTFLSLNLFTFYLAFEATILPIGALIVQWGSSDKRYFAARQYVFYSIISGLPLLAGLGHVYNLYGSLDYIFLLNNLFMLSYNEQLYLWCAFFIVFAVKIPLFPFHSWLLNAHVEASTGVSIILAAVLLKIGSFGVIRYLLGLFHLISAELAQHVCFLALFGVVYASFSAITEVDLKRLIAYTSVAHMNLAVIGLFMFDESAFYGSVITMLSHSIISTALFFIVGVLYSRTHVREIIVYGGMAQLMPILSSFLFFFAIANAGFPCSVSFFGELFLLIAIFKKFGLSFIILICVSSLLLLYANLRLFIYVSFGTINDNFISPAISDLGHIELAVSSILFLNAFLMFIKFDHYFYPLFFDYLARYFV